MTSTDVATRTDTSPPRLNRKTGKPLKVTGKVSEALDLMIFEGMRWADACLKVGMPKRTARAAIDRPHVLQELRRRKQVFRADVSAANILKLAEIRDQTDNRMAALGAIKALEQIDEESEQRSANRSAPGVTIVIAAPASLTAHQPSIDAKPLIEQDDVSQPANDDD